MNREEAYRILTTYLKNRNLIKHCLATEAVMKRLCVYLNPNASQEEIEKWGITGLLHDADYEMSFNHPEKHGILITEKVDLPPDIAYAIRAHNYQWTKVLPQSPMDFSIACADQLTGLIVAATLVHPDPPGEAGKKITSVTPEFVLKKFYDKSFARGADRASIMACEEKLSIPLLKFIEIVLASMKEIAPQLGL